MRWQHLPFKATPVRAFLEMLLFSGIVWAGSFLFCHFLVPAYVPISFPRQEAVLLADIFCMLYYVLRLRIPARFWSWQTARDVLLALGVILLQSIAAAIFIHFEVLPFVFESATPPTHNQMVIAVTIGLFVANCIGYFLCRVGTRVLLFWNRLRRRHLLWALTHSHVLLVVLVAGLLILGVDVIFVRMSRIPFDMLMILPITLFLAIPSVIALMIIVPPFALFSYFVIRRTTDRLRMLMSATSALRAGNYAVRVPVVGEDEVAQLQTDFNVMAADLERTMGALQQERDRVAALLQERRQLIANVSHELRTPVATLRGYLETTLMHWDDIAPSQLHHDLCVMEDETIHLQARVEELFTLARADVGQPVIKSEPTEVGMLVQRVVDARAPLIWQTSRIDLVADAPSHVPDALADPHRLEQALQNLLHNGVRHTSPGGIVAVVVRAEGHEVLLQVRDTGEGIEAKDLPHIWERFYQTESARTRMGGGTGLGLALVKEWIEGMGGSVSVESAPGEGSCFTLRLPQTEPQRSIASSPQQDVSSPHPRSRQAIYHLSA
ncbi:MAG TPA: HAMP domain-containing sensor histidine kinase [Ktedonosporobacter sp.]|nr:HAMP domain-containing sensor histidine kinase [Ktedonosporobacter sp.]